MVITAGNQDQLSVKTTADGNGFYFHSAEKLVNKNHLDTFREQIIQGHKEKSFQDIKCNWSSVWVSGQNIIKAFWVFRTLQMFLNVPEV